MISLPVTFPISPSRYQLSIKRVRWSFKDGKTNPIMWEKLKQGGYTARFSSQGLTVKHPASAETWTVHFDHEGFILRANDFRFSLNGAFVNAFSNARPTAAYVPFWDIIFQRDLPPLEAKRETKYSEFITRLNDLLSAGDKFLYYCYLKATVGDKGEIELNDHLLWSLPLSRRYTGKEVFVVPLSFEDNLALGVYNIDTRAHLNTFNFDPTTRTFFELRLRKGSIQREYFIRAPQEKSFTHRGLTFYLNERTKTRDILVLEEKGRAFTVREQDRASSLPLFPIIRDEKIVGYLIGKIWPKGPLPITGKILKATRLFQNKKSPSLSYAGLDKEYRMLDKDAARLGLKLNDRVIMTMEEGQVVEVKPERGSGKIYNRIIRDKDWKILNTSRFAFPSSYFKTGIRILEGLTTHKRIEPANGHEIEGFGVLHHFIALGLPVNQPYNHRPISVAIQIKGKAVKLLYYSLSPRFDQNDRRNIDGLMTGKTTPAAKITDNPLLAADLANIFNGHGAPLSKTLADLRRYIEGREINTAAIAGIVNITYSLAMQDHRTHNRALEVFANFHRLFAAISPEHWTKTAAGLLVALRTPDTRKAVLVILRNGLYSEEAPAIKQLLAKSPKLEREIKKSLRFFITEE